MSLSGLDSKQNYLFFLTGGLSRSSEIQEVYELVGGPMLIDKSQKSFSYDLYLIIIKCRNFTKIND